MKILVINTGSSSIKYRLFDMAGNLVLASGVLERIGEETSALTATFLRDGEVRQKSGERLAPDHRSGMRLVADALTDPETGVLTAASEVEAVGHRVVHGGEDFVRPAIIDGRVIEAIKRNFALAPLHNPVNLVGIEVAMSVFDKAVHVAVFDTAFHQTMPARAFRYALPPELYIEFGIRRYGFHGSSHGHVSELAARMLGKKPDEVSLITIHLGNGASMAAIKKGKCIDTSMGMTPLEGLVMGTRSGDVDPSIVFHLASNAGMGLDEINDALNKRSGLKGLCGENDVREILARKAKGDGDAALALEVYAYRVKKYIGAYMAALGGADAVVFTAGIGENSPEIRAACLEGLECLGLELDREKNEKPGHEAREISSPASRVKALVIPTNEELEIARKTHEALSPDERSRL